MEEREINMITYGSTTLTSYNTITKIEVYYYKSTSATSLSGGSWSTTKPTWENGKYIWQKIRTMYEGKLDNGSYYSESDPVNITGQQGATGTSAYSYKLNASDTVVSISKNGIYSTNNITFSATYKQGTEAISAYAGRFKIETTTDGATWTTQYTSSANESSKKITLPENILVIRCSLYQAGGTTVLLDIVSVPIVKDGIDGALYPNLAPFFSHDLSDVYNAETNPNGYWVEYSSYGWTKNSAYTFTQLEDGWLHVHVDNSSGTATIRNDCCIPRYNPSIKRATMYTFLVEFRNNQSTGAASGSDFYLVQQSGSVQFWGQNPTTAPAEKLEGIGWVTTQIASIPSDGSYAISRFTKYSEPEIGSTSHWTAENDMMVTFVFRAEAGAVLDYDVRLSVYEGEYWGGYVPYIISDVTDIRKSAEDAHYKIDNMEIGGRNLIPHSKNLQSFTIEHIERIVATYLEDSCTIVNIYGDSRYGIYYNIEVEPNATYTFSFYASDISGTNANYGIGNQTPGQTASWSNITGGFQQLIEGKTVYTFTVPDTITVIRIYFCVGSLNGTCTIKNVKLEKGNKPTDWSPAPEDLDATIGARNLLLDSRDVRTSQVSANGSAYILPSLTLSDYGNSILNTDDYYTYSFDYEVTGNTAENAFIYVQIKGSSVPSNSKGYYGYVYNTPSGKYVCTFKINDTQISATGLACGIWLRLATDGATFTVKNAKLEKGNRATDWTPAPEDTQADIDQAKNLATAVYGTCSTAATTPLKEVVCENFILFDGVRIQVAFENANSTNVPSINVNNTGAKQILINQATVSESNQLLWAENAQLEFVYDGTYWVLQNAPYSLYGICSVTEEIPAKVIECAEAVICKGTTITVDFMYSNTSDNTVFNVANIAQKPLLVNGDVLKVNSRFNWHAGAIRTFYFDGQAWNMSDDIVSAYIDEYETEQDEDGIMVHPVGQKNTGWSIGSTLELLKNGVSYIKMWFDKVEDGEFSLPFIRIGKESGNHVLVGDDAVTIREDQKELAHYSSLGITFDDETPYKIGNDTTYIAFEDTDNDAKADSLRIVADSISFHSNGTEKDLRSELEGLNENIDLNAQAIEQNAEAIENTQKYIQIDPEVPSIKLATNDRNYLLIESNKLGFWVDANETAYMSQNQMNIPTASITNLLMQTTNAETGETIGQIGWVMRTNGHLSLKIMN